MVILHINEEEVNEKLSDKSDEGMDMVSITLLKDNHSSCSRKKISWEIYLQSCVLDRSDSEYEESESFMFETDASLRDYNDINLVSQESIIYDDENLDNKTPSILVNKIIGIERSMICTNEEVALIQAISNIEDLIVTNYSNFQNLLEITSTFEKNLVQKNQNDHGSFVGANEYLNMGLSYYGDHIVGYAFSSDTYSLISDKPEDKVSNDFSENINVLFDEDADEDQLVF